MKEVRVTASNVMLVPQQDKTLQPVAELILGVSEVQYIETQEGVEQKRQLEAVRLAVTKPILLSLVKTLVELGEVMDALDAEYNRQK